MGWFHRFVIMKFDFKKRETDKNENTRIFNNGKATTTNFVRLKKKQLIFKTVDIVHILEDIVCVLCKYWLDNFIKNSLKESNFKLYYNWKNLLLVVFFIFTDYQSRIPAIIGCGQLWLWQSELLRWSKL